MDGIFKFLDGYKTYIGAGVLLLAAYTAYQNGDTELATLCLGNAIGLLGIRHALAKGVPLPKPPATPPSTPPTP